MGNNIDIGGKKFNLLTAIKGVDNNKHGQQRWLFRCECGVFTIIDKSPVTQLRQLSCGCLKIISSRKTALSEKCRKNRIAGSTTHGMANTRFYSIWSGMHARCNCDHGDSFKKYASLGTSVCNEWKIFENFRDDMYESYLKHVEEFGEGQTTIDRMNNNGSYCKDNCRWLTPAGQVRNRTITKKSSYNGLTLTLQEWSDKIGISYHALYYQHITRGLTIQEIIQRKCNPKLA